ncbi:MAG: protein-disulfide reductase DsbD domain-containing protein, partial [Flavobacteriales bacterium]
ALVPALCGSPVKWRFSAGSSGDGLVRVELRAQVEADWHIYATSLPSDEGPIPTSIRFAPSDAYALAGPLQEPQPVEAYDPNFGMVVRYHDGSPVFVQWVRPSRPGAFEVRGEVEYMVCNDKTCLPPVTVPFALKVESM